MQRCLPVGKHLVIKLAALVVARAVEARGARGAVEATPMKPHKPLAKGNGVMQRGATQLVQRRGTLLCLAPRGMGQHW